MFLLRTAEVTCRLNKRSAGFDMNKNETYALKRFLELRESG